MKIIRFVTDLMHSNMYIISEGSNAIAIDPWQRYNINNDLRIETMIVTHEHYDHISGVNLFKNHYNAKLLCSKECSKRIVNSRTNSARYFEAFSQLQAHEEQELSLPIDPNYICNADLVFEDEVYFEWMGNKLFLFSLPGHSPGSIGILLNNKYLFSGDSIFMDRDVEVRFLGGSKKQWREISAPKLNSLSDDIIVYPGHGEKFTLKERRARGGF